MLAATSATANFFNIDVFLSRLIVRFADRMRHHAWASLNRL